MHWWLGTGLGRGLGLPSRVAAFLRGRKLHRFVAKLRVQLYKRLVDFLLREAPLAGSRERDPVVAVMANHLRGRTVCVWTETDAHTHTQRDREREREVERQTCVRQHKCAQTCSLAICFLATAKNNAEGLKAAAISFASFSGFDLSPTF